MRRRMLCGIWIAVVCLVLAVPAYAYTGNANGGNGGLGNGMGSNGTNRGNSSQLKVQSIDTGKSSDVTRNHDVSVYGTGTGTQFLNMNRNDPNNAMNHIRSQSYTDGGYRALETTTTRDFDWSWLGLLGLLGLFGIRNRNPQRGR